MADVPDAHLKAAEARGRDLLASEPRAVSARYDVATGRVHVELASGCAYAFPTQRVEELQGASQAALADIEIDGAGFNLLWRALDADLFVPALVSGIFGTRAFMARARARHAGRAQSPAKAAAARAKGAKGGRPRKALAG